MRTDDEAKGYAKGYAAGRRKARRERVIEAYRRQQQARYDRFLCAAISGLLSSPRRWERDGKPDSSAGEYADTAANIASELMRKSP